MPDDIEIEHRFWRALRSDMTVMLGLDAPHRVPPRPMTAQVEGDGDHGPIWFFTSRDSSLTTALAGPQPATFTFVDKGHGVFASATGTLGVSNDRATIDRLWNPFVAAWYKGGKDDPDVTLLRFDPKDAEIWLDGSSLLAGLKILLGSDPQKDYAGNVAKVSLA